MKARIYNPGEFPFAHNLILRLPKHRPPGPPEFLWMRCQFENVLCGISQYNLDGGLAVSLDPIGLIVPVHFTSKRMNPLTIRILKKP